MEFSPQITNLLVTFVIPAVLSLFLARTKTKKNVGQSVINMLSHAIKSATPEPEPEPDKTEPTNALLELVRSSNEQMMAAVGLANGVINDRLVELETKLRDGRETIKSLQQDVTTLQSFRDKDRLLIDALQRKVNELETSLSGAKKELEIAIHERDAANLRADNADTERKATEQKYNALRQEFRAMQSELTDVKTALALLQAVTVPRAEVDKLTRDVSEVKRATTGNLPPFESVLPPGTEKKDNAA